ncbi:MAG TPA: glycosyltransferase family 1 protein [Chloroflexota bacterium]|jgi:glycosyltransferase involved in cell wall biosynthesis
MRIAFDVSALSAPHSGVATYTRNLAHHLSSQQHDQVLPMTHSSLLRGLGQRALPINKTLWMQALLPLQLSRVAADVCHFTNSVASWWTPCPSIVTIHDMTLWMFPRYHPRRRLLAMRPFIPSGARRAQAIIAVSAATKRDVVRTLRVPESKVHVIYEAAAPQFRPLASGGAVEAVRRKYGLPESFILYVGTIEPRKNLVRLFQAFDQVRRHGCRSCALVLVGHRGWSDAAILASVERLQLDGAVRVLGHAPTDDIVSLYNLAEVVVLPSLYEGFGLPVIEAMACGTPVVTSPNGSLAEIAGNAAEFVDPTQVDSIAAGLRAVLCDRDKWDALHRAGLERAAQFSWEATAEQTRQVYAAVSNGRA